MSRTSRALRAERERKRQDAKRVRRVQRDQRTSRMRMTVVSAILDRKNPVSLNQVVQQTHAALLYADEVTLVSPVAAMMKSVLDVSRLDGMDLLFELGRVAPRYFPDVDPAISELREIVEGLPPRSRWPSDQRREYDALVKQFTRQMQPLRDKLQESADGILTESKFDQLQLAIDAGILVVDPLPGIDVSEIDDTAAVAIGSLFERIDEALSSGRQYPLFDGETNQFVHGAVELGIFAPTPAARRLGKNAAMADGLFDCLPSFQNATTSEILDIRTELSPSLGAFRQGVGSLTENLEFSPAAPQFGDEVEYAWNETVAPAIDEIEEIVRQNRSMTDLMKRFAKDSLGGGAVGLAATAPFALAVAAGPAAQMMTAAGMAFGTVWGTARALIDEHDAIEKDAKGAQFYFLYGTRERLGLG
jgi:hypothetical protein